MIPRISRLIVPAHFILEISDIGGAKTFFNCTGEQYGFYCYLPPFKECKAKRRCKDNGLKAYTQEGRNAARFELKNGIS
jgi:hypothetical protein